jgi:putative inorganic carbon (HCO3(-)) transporter
MAARLRRYARFLTSIEIWPVGFLVVASLISSRLLLPAFALALLFWPVRYLASSRLSQRTSLDWAILLLALTTVASLWVTSFPDITFPQVYRLLGGMALFYAIVNWTDSVSRLRWMESGTIAAGLLLALLAPFSVQWDISKFPFIPAGLYQRFIQLFSDTVNPNVMAGNLAILLPIALGWLVFGWRQLSWRQRTLASAAVLMVLGMVFLTQSRGAWLALGVVVIAMITLRWGWGWLVSLGMTLAGSLSAYLIGFKQVADFLLRGTSLGGLDGRLEVWTRAVFLIQDFPLTGVSIGTFGRVADTLYPFFQYAPGKIDHAHNLFLQVAVDLGIPGLIAWLSILSLVTLASWQIYHRGRVKMNLMAAGLGAGLLCSQIALVVHGLTDAVTWGMVRPAPLVWVVWALAIAGCAVYNKTGVPQPAPSEISGPG